MAKALKNVRIKKYIYDDQNKRP